MAPRAARYGASLCLDHGQHALHSAEEAGCPIGPQLPWPCLHATQETCLTFHTAYGSNVRVRKEYSHSFIYKRGGSFPPQLSGGPRRPTHSIGWSRSSAVVTNCGAYSSHRVQDRAAQGPYFRHPSPSGAVYHSHPGRVTPIFRDWSTRFPQARNFMKPSAGSDISFTLA
jgi:hypothetical protein